jgi:signal recognition particle subunit SEC65
VAVTLLVTVQFRLGRPINKEWIHGIMVLRTTVYYMVRFRLPPVSPLSPLRLGKCLYIRHNIMYLIINMISIDYIAGIIDGEGSIGIRKNRIRVVISNTNIEMLNKIKEYLGFGNVKDYDKRNPKWNREGRFITRNNNEAKILLSAINGKLIIKQNKCTEGLKILENYEKFLIEKEHIKIKALEMLKTKSIRQVAKEIGYSHAAVGRWKLKSELNK